ncbi:MAG: T9SS type B sorting domain-containing protein [Moheibacter sp.]
MKRFYFLIFALFISSIVYSQGDFINVGNITRTGNFAACGNNPIITAQLITSEGSEVIDGDLKITDPCGFTTLRVLMTNLRYNQPGFNWPHGFFFPEGEYISVTNVNLPAGWISQNSCTGASCSAQETGGVGFYFDGSNGSSCTECFPSTNDGNPSNNYGQSSMDCNTNFSIGFDMTFCNSRVETETTFFTLKGTSDGNTGCWSIPDTQTNTVNFSINTIASEIPLFESGPSNPEVITECLNGGAQFNYIAVLEAECGSGDDVTWWSSASGGTLLGTGSPFYWDPPGQACPQGAIIYASCCPDGEGCERKPVIVGPCLPPSDVPTFAPIPPQCPGMDSPLPPQSIEGVTGTWTPEFDPFNTATYTFTPDPGQCATVAVQVEVVILPMIDLTFQPIDPICQFDTPPPLPNPTPNVGGSWSPAVIDTSTPGVFEYTYTPDNTCSEIFTMEITILEKIIPLFDLQPHYCEGTEIIVLPTTSDNGYPGTWVPAQVDTSIVGSQTYVFTPSGDGCVETFPIVIEVEAYIIPTFADVPELCQYSTPPALPQPNEGITGNWQPAVIDTSTPGTFDYTFTPDMECSEPVTIQVVISPEIVAEFSLQNSYCQFETPEQLPTTAGNGITGVWFPAVIDTDTPGVFNYTFVPDTGQCSNDFVLTIEIYEKPVLNSVVPQLLCDDDFDGIYHSNLNSLNPLLGGGTGVAYTYYASMADYNNDIPIPTGQLNDYQFTVLPATIYAAGTSGQGCKSNVVPITFDKGETVQHNSGPFGPIEFCHGDSIDLTQYEAQISGVTGVEFGYYNNLNNAQTDSNMIVNPDDFNPAENQNSVFVRIEAGDFCPAIVEITLLRHPLPLIEIPEPLVRLCPDDEYEVTATSDDPDAIFQWTLNNGNTVDGPTIVISEIGTYTVIAHSLFGCASDVRTLTVTLPAIPVITQIEISGNNLIIGATNNGEGPIEYSLDGIFWQSSNQFPNLIPGEVYTVWVRSSGCMTAKTEVAILAVPNFISPNGDGINDTWMIRGIQAYKGATIKIFDRYGKVFVDRKLEAGYEWDGKYMGRVVPSDDYWYIIQIPATELTPAQKFVGHISVRNQ